MKSLFLSKTGYCLLDKKEYNYFVRKKGYDAVINFNLKTG